MNTQSTSTISRGFLWLLIIGLILILVNSITVSAMSTTDSNTKKVLKSFVGILIGFLIYYLLVLTAACLWKADCKILSVLHTIFIVILLVMLISTIVMSLIGKGNKVSNNVYIEAPKEVVVDTSASATTDVNTNVNNTDVVVSENKDTFISLPRKYFMT